jgi:malonyl-CoA/methylmalonyl-CoA synthetase
VVSRSLVDLLSPPRERWDAVALRIPDGEAMTFGELDVASRELAERLAHHGVRKGDRVVYQVQKSAHVVVLHLALLHAGAIQVPVNPSYPEAEVGGIVRDAQPVLVVRDPLCPLVPGAWDDFTLDAHGQGSLLTLPLGNEQLPTSTADDGAAILFTSGTTGRPKGALLSHGNLVHNAESLIAAWGFTASDNLVHVLPLFHTHGLFVALHCALGSGATVTLLPSFTPSQAVSCMSGEAACTVMMGVPTHYARLLRDTDIDREAAAAMRLFVSGSAPMPPALHADFKSRTGHVVLERYGMTETSMLTSNPLRGERKPGSVGLPLPGTHVRLVDTVADDGSDASEQPVGAVEVRGPTVFAGYWNRPELHDEAFTDDGWFRTGDLGRIDDDGYLHLVGRSKDLVITGGLNVYPTDVEAAIDSLDGVVESAVVGVPDDDLGERVVAAVVPVQGATLDEAELRQQLRRTLAGYQIPKQIVVLAELPRNVMGKVQKAELRRLMAPS